jgi:hypothetical protein
MALNTQVGSKNCKIGGSEEIEQDFLSVLLLRNKQTCHRGTEAQKNAIAVFLPCFCASVANLISAAGRINKTNLF